jgi:amidohydrolase
VYASADDFRIVVRGRQSHGASPWHGVDPIVASAQIVTALQSIVSRNVNLIENPAAVTVGRIQGGVRSNIIPGEVEMIGTARALTPGDRTLLHERLRSIATSVAEAMGATADVEIPYGAFAPVTYNDPALTSQMVPVLESVAGADRVHRLPPELGAEDFGFIAERVPSFYFTLGGRPSHVAEADAPDHHTPEFHIDDSGLGLGVRAMTAVALHYLTTHPRAGATRH